MVKMKSIKAIFRRGQQTSKYDTQTPETVSRTSSISNINVETKHKGAKPKKIESKEKQSENKDNKSSKNNNKESSHSENATEGTTYSLEKKLAGITKDKARLSEQFAEQSMQIIKMQDEMSNLKLSQEEYLQKIDKLTDENSILRNRLRDVAHSPLSDTEKQQLLYDSQRHHNSAPASIATNVNSLLVDSEVSSLPIEWEKHSSSNVSEISVACLQVKINQMQETHYSTKEELQATVQELTDLQRQLTDFQQENIRLNDEKTLMFESLCRQTERLNESRLEVDSLKQLLYTDDTDQFETAVEREQKLVDLLKSSHDEREVLLMKQEHLNNELEDSRSTNLIHNSEILDLTERIKNLESRLESKHAEYIMLEHQLSDVKDESDNRQIEIDGMKDLLDNARAKINELENSRVLGDKSESDELLDNYRKEKDILETEIAHLKEKNAFSKNDNQKLREKILVLQEECKVIRNNAKMTQSDMEYKLDKLLNEKTELNQQLQEFQDIINDCQDKIQSQLDEKRQISSILSETQRNLNEAEKKNIEVQNELTHVKHCKQDQEEEWEKFQNDLLTSVRVANEFKTEAQQNLQKLIIENKTSKDRIKQLEAQVEKQKASNDTLTIHSTTFQVEDITTRRSKIPIGRTNNRQSVKSLIESIETGAKPIVKGVSLHLNMVSRSSSTSSVNSVSLEKASTPNVSSSPRSPLRNYGDWSETVKPPLKEQQTNNINREWSKTISGELQDPLNALIKNGGSKRNALLKWCQSKTVGYRNIDITNFSSSWNDGLALCALLHTYLPDRIPYDTLMPSEKRRNFLLAFSAAESVGIWTSLNINDMVQLERPDWQQVMTYVTTIYKHFES